MALQWNASNVWNTGLHQFGENIPQNKVKSHTRAAIPIFFSWLDSPRGFRPPHYRRFEVTLRHTTVGRTPLDEWLARRTNIYLTTHNTHKRQTSMPSAGFETAIPESNQPRGHWDRQSLILVGIKLKLKSPLNTGLFEMIIGVLTTCHTQYTWDRSMCIFLFNRTTLQVLVTYLRGALYVPLNKQNTYTPIPSVLCMTS